ncbi:body wall muscle protein HR-29-like [Styela clava]|uniref:body wall muscle protein HR-29-like n=1 Tax=Styela clava TaxID=7725 RepID=UPI0019393E9E|nr:body wall muscle protein HR-29-like [Styela clava]
MSLRPFDAFFHPLVRHRPYPIHFMDPFHWPMSSRTTEDDEFDEFIRNVDSRFSGILSNLNNSPSSVRMKESAGDPSKFEMKIAVHDFGPDDIKVKVQGDNLLIEAKREEKQEKEGMYAHSYREFRRTFPIPEGVDKKKLSSALHGGVLEIEAPRLAPAIEKPPEKKKIEVTHMEE